MSTTIDQRVVEMRFDNKNFENNVHTTLSTLDKLKQRLNLTGASKGLENVGSAAKKIDLSGIGNAADTVHAKFSALEVMGVTALANITNSAVNAGKRMISALTIDPIKTGFQEYETQINAVQTILANTQHNGTTIDEVNNALDTLNTYADKTIYNFTEMTRNIGTFTAAGVDLQTSVDSIQGIANLAAVSGSTSQQASTAMYQLSQALAAGKVSLMDWNSVVNAGMGGKVFQDALVRTSELLKTGAKGAIETYGSFRESLTKGEWLTTEVLTETLKQFSGAYSEAELIAQGFTEEQAKDIAAMAKTAEDAATKVKTWTQLWDVLKESAQSGWTQTWELLFGDFEEAKELLTPLADFLTNIIGKMSDARNKLLEGALAKSFTGMLDKISTVTSGVEGAVDSLKNYSEVVDKIINGDFGNGQSRWDKLTEAGYDWAHAQNLVNEKLGDSTRHTTEYKEAQDKLTDSQSKSVKTQSELSKAELMHIARLAKMSDEQLKSKGYTDEQIKALRELSNTADKLGIPLKEFIMNIDEINGRWLLINSFKNIGKGLITVFKAIGEAWKDAFPPIQSDQLFNIIAAFHKFSTKLVVSEETADKLTRTLKGVFSVIGMISDVLGGGLKIAFKAINALLSYFNMDILDVTASIGDALVAFRKATDLSNLFGKAIKFIAPYVEIFAENVREWANSFKEIPQVQNIITYIKESLTNLKELDFKEIGEYIIEGLVNGLGAGAGKAIETIIDLGKKIITGICEVLGIQSPSKEFFAIGQYIIEGLINGIQNALSGLWGTVKDIGTKIIDLLGKIDWNTVFAGGVSIAMLVTIKKIADVFETLASPLEGLGDLFSSTAKVLKKSAKGIGKILKSFSKVLSSFAFSIQAKAIRNIAISLAILVGAVALLAFLDTKKLWNAVGVLAVIAGILIVLIGVVEGLSILSAKFGSGSIDFGKLSLGLLGISASILILGAAVKLVGSLNPEQAKQGFLGLAGMVVALIGVIAAYGMLVKGKSSQNVDKFGKFILKLSISMLLLVGVVKLIGKLSADDMKKGAAFAGAFIVFVGLLAAASRLAGKQIDKIGGFILKLSISMLLLVGVVKLVGKLTVDEMKKGAAFAGAFIVFVALLCGITRFAKSVDGLGKMLLSMSVSMLILVGVAKLIAGMSWEDMGKAGAGILALTVIMGLLVKMVKNVGPQAPKIAGTLIAMSVSIGILAGVAILLSLIDIKGLAKGIIAVGILGAIISGMIIATKGANDIKGSIIAMAIAIGVMAVAIAALSMIDPKKLIGPTIALSTLIGMFALIIKSSKNVTGSIGPLIVMTVAIGLLGGLLFLLSGLPIESTLGAAASLSLLMLALSTSMLIISKTGTISPMALVSLGVMTLIVGSLAGILYLIRDLPTETTLTNVISLTILLTTLTGVTAILGAMSGLITAAIPAVVGLGIVIAELAILLAAMGGLAQIPGLEWLISEGGNFLYTIGNAIGQFIGGIVGGVAEGAAAVLPEIANSLTGFMNNIQGFITGAQNIDENVILGAGYLSAAILAITAADFIAGLVSLGGLSLVELGFSLSNFIIAATPFLTAIQTINPESVEAAKTLAEMILVLTAAELISGITSFIGGSADFSTFGTQLVAFGKAVCEFSNTLVSNGGINDEAVTSAANAGKVMAGLQSSLYGAGGLKQDIFGDKDLSTFGTQLVAFGKAICEFSNTLVSNGGINEEAVTSAANAGTVMAELQSSLYGAGGLKQDIFGDKDLSVFATQLVAFGKAICEFSNTLVSNGGINEEAVTSAANAGKVMAALQSEIESAGGLKQDIFGEKNLEDFGAQIKAFGQAMVDFSGVVADNINDDAVTAASNAGRVMAEVQSAIPEDKWLDGKISIDDFGKKIVKFGQGLVDYSEKVVDVDSDAVSNSLTAAQRLVRLANSVVDLDTSGIDTFKDIKGVGSTIKDYYSKVSEIDTSVVASSITSAQRLVSFINSLASLDSSGIGSFKSAISSLSTISFSDLEKAFSSALPKLTTVGGNMVESLVKGMKSKQSSLTSLTNTMISSVHKSITSKLTLFRTAGISLMTNFISGITNQSSKVKSSMTSIVSSSITSINKYYDDFYNAGSYLVTGFANGIDENAYKAEAMAAAMAEAAKEAAEEVLGINSPSKVFYGIGNYTGLGFINALNDYADKSYEAGSSIADSARKGLTNAISKLKYSIDNGIDSQPTIRPVMDLSGVESGANAISNMLNMDSSVGVISNVRSINSMMNRRNQNGGNDNIVSEIKKLRKDLNDIERTNYTINGITYDDGSNISDAVKSLVRAAKVERRI